MLNLGQAVAILLSAEVEQIEGFDKMSDGDQMKKSLDVAIPLVGEIAGRFVSQLESNGFDRDEAMSILIATISREE